MTTTIPALIPPEDARLRLMLAGLAREIVMGLEDVPSILQRKGLSSQQYEKILKNPYYNKILAEATEAWTSATNAAERTRITALFLIEQAMPNYYVRITDKTEPLPAVTEGMKFLARTAGIAEVKAGIQEGGKFVISINLGHGKLIEHEVKTIDNDPQPQPEEKTNGTAIPK